MGKLRTYVGLAGVTALLVVACSTAAPATQAPATQAPQTQAPGTAAPESMAPESMAPEPAAVSLQLQWAPQAQFAGYFAADAEGFYADEGLTVTMVPGGPDVLPHVVGSDPAGPEFTISWVPKVLEVRANDLQSDLVNIAQIFQRSGTRSVSWAAGRGPSPTVDEDITSPEQFAGKRIGVWDFGNEYEVTAAALNYELEQGTDYEKVIQPFDMTLLLTRQIDVAEAMIYNEYAQVLEAENPDTGELWQPEDLNVIDYNDEDTAMLQDAIFARAAWLAEEGNEDIAIRFLRASFRGWIFCRDNPDACIQHTVDAGSTLGAGHQAWMMNEVNPLIWPSDLGIGAMSIAEWTQTVNVSIGAEIIPEEPSADAYRNDLADAARAGIEEDTVGAGFEKGEVEVTPGGE
jgi:NitT/TauT family transport system substrate-binding protein